LDKRRIMTQMDVTGTTSQQIPTYKKPKKGLSDTQFAILLILPAATLLIVIILYPLLNSMYLGFFSKSLVYPGQEFVGLKNIRSVLQGDFWLIFKNTVVFTFWATLIPFL